MVKKNAIFSFPNSILGLLILIVLIANVNGYSQDTTTIYIVDNDRMFTNPDFNPDAYLFTGNVVFRQDSTWFFCDSAQLFEKENTLNAFGSVRVLMKDSLQIFGDSLNYLGNSRKAYIYGDVKMVDDQGTLYTDLLIYDRNTKVGSYLTGGKIVDSLNTLTSIKGYYYTDLDEFYFQDSVHLVNPDYVMDSDTMMYHTKHEIVTILGPTVIVSDSNTIRGTSGWYDTKKDISEFDERASLDNGKQILFGDSLYYDRNLDFGKAINNVILYDSVKELLAIGHYAEYWKPEKYAFITDSAVSIMADTEDSLFMHGDTIRIYFDEEDEAEMVKCYYKTKFFRSDMQGKCDSLVYLLNDSTISLYEKPILWANKTQLIGDTIRILLANNKIHQLHLLENSFIISIDSLENYNQMKGTNTIAHFVDNELSVMVIKGNAESIYFMRDEETMDIIGILKAKSSSIRIYMDEGEIKAITFIEMPVTPIHPEKELPVDQRRLEEFKWLIKHKPLKKEDIFNWTED